MDNSLISVIVPIYKVENYLRKCVDSIINQTYKNLEIILVDDGSPDNCGKICDDYAQRDSRVKVIHKENGGLSDARNAGIEIAKGEYISFVDSDDYIELNMMEKLYSRIKRDCSDMAICDIMHVCVSGKEYLDENKKIYIRDEIIDKNEALNKLCKFGSECYVIVCNKLFKKTLFEGIRFPKGKVNEDAFVIHHIYDKCIKISCVSDKLYCYVRREDSITNSGFDKTKLDLAEAMLDGINFAVDRNLNELAYCFFSGMGTAILRFRAYDDLSKKEKKDILRLYSSMAKKINFKDLSVKRKAIVMLCRISPKIVFFIKGLRR